jgi:hypothetical protein
MSKSIGIYRCRGLSITILLKRRKGDEEWACKRNLDFIPKYSIHDSKCAT